MVQSVMFFGWDNDKELEVQLEPDAIIFKVMPGKELTFTAEFDSAFKWAIRVDNATKAVQLYPETLHPFSLTIYEDGELLNDWYKFMKA